MNLHEECLLKYLLNPSNLLKTTEVLIANNNLIQKGLSTKIMLTSSTNKGYAPNRV